MIFLILNVNAPSANSKEFYEQNSRKSPKETIRFSNEEFFDNKFSYRSSSKGHVQLPDLRELKNKVQFVEQNYEIKDQFLAFSDKLVYRPGEKIKLYIKAEGVFTIDLLNVSTGKTELIESAMKSLKNSNSIHFNTFYGFEKIENFTEFVYVVPNHFGWFNFNIYNQNLNAHIPIFIEDVKGRPVLFIESTDTLKAYNSKETFRNMYSNPRRVIIGEFTRSITYPMNYKILDYSAIINSNERINCNEHLINADFLHKKNLDSLKIAFDNVSDEFLDNELDLMRYKMIVLGTHNEYWSQKKLYRITEYLEKGGSLLILGGNTAWGWIMRSKHFEVIFGSNILRTEKKFEPFLSNILGSYYSAEGFDTYAPFEATKAINKLGIEIPANNEFAVSSDFNSCREKILGGSGHETDKLYDKSVGFDVIAVGKNVEGGANVVHKKFNSGGQVLNFGSLSLWHRSTDLTVRKLISFIYENSQTR